MFPLFVQIYVCIKNVSLKKFICIFIYKYCSSKSHTCITLTTGAQYDACWDWLRWLMCVCVCVCVFLVSGSCRTHPTLHRSPLAEIWLYMNINEEVTHTREGGGGSLMTVQEKTRASTGMYDCSAPATDMIKWLNLNMCVCVLPWSVSRQMDMNNVLIASPLW